MALLDAFRLYSLQTQRIYPKVYGVEQISTLPPILRQPEFHPRTSNKILSKMFNVYPYIVVKH